MFSLILLISFSQFNDDQNFTDKFLEQVQAREKRQEVIENRRFLEIQEHWIIDSMDSQHPFKSIGATFGKRTGQLFNSLSCDHFGCRDTAVEQIYAMNEDAFQPLIWASRHKVTAIRETAIYLLKIKFYSCYYCEGDGVTEWQGECLHCNGTGHMWIDLIHPPQPDKMPEPE